MSEGWAGLARDTLGHKKKEKEKAKILSEFSQNDWDIGLNLTTGQVVEVILAIIKIKNKDGVVPKY